MTKHTPGPLGFMGTKEFGYAVHNGAGTVVADKVRVEADARLIAAAPDLLAALVELERIAVSVANGNGHSPAHLHGPVKVAQDALARVKEMP